MAIERKTVVDQIEIRRDGIMQIRMGLLLVDSDTGEELATDWHRTALEPGVDADLQFAAVNSHLQAMGRQPVPAGEIARVKQFVPLAHTPEVIAAHAARKESALQRQQSAASSVPR